MMLAAVERAVQAAQGPAYDEALRALCAHGAADAGALADALWLLDAERAAADDAPCPRLAGLVADLARGGVLPHALLLERLDGPLLEAAGAVPSAAAFGKRVVRANTAAVYRQQRFNLAREEPEGFAKVLRLAAAVARGLAEPRDAFAELVSLVGFFDLDPVRCADVLLGALLVLPVDEFGVWDSAALDSATRIIRLLQLMDHRPATVDGLLGLRLGGLGAQAVVLAAPACQMDARWATAAAALVRAGLATADGLVAHLAAHDGLPAALASLDAALSSLEERLGAGNPLSVGSPGQSVISAVSASHPLPYYLAAAVRTGDARTARGLLEMHPGAARWPAASHALAWAVSDPSGRRLYGPFVAPSVFAHSRDAFVAMCASVSAQCSGISGQTTGPESAAMCASISAQCSATPDPTIGPERVIMMSGVESTTGIGMESSGGSGLPSASSEPTDSPVPLADMALFLLKALRALHPANECADALWTHVLSRLPFPRLCDVFETAHLHGESADGDQLTAAAELAIRSAARRTVRRLTADSGGTLGASLAALLHAAPVALAAMLSEQLVAYESMAAPVAAVLPQLGALPAAALLWAALRPLAARPGERSRPDGQAAPWLSALASFLGAFARRCAEDESSYLLGALVRAAASRLSVPYSASDSSMPGVSPDNHTDSATDCARGSASDVAVISEILGAVAECPPLADPSDAQRDALAGGRALASCVLASSSAAHARLAPCASAARRAAVAARSAFFLRVLAAQDAFLPLFAALSAVPRAVARLGADAAAAGENGLSVRTLRGLVDAARLAMQQLLSLLALHGAPATIAGALPPPGEMVELRGCDICDVSALWRILDSSSLLSSAASFPPLSAPIGRLFWAHGLGDVHFPSARYLSEAVRLRTLLAGTCAAPSESRDAAQAALDALEHEMGVRAEHVQRCRASLAQALRETAFSGAPDASAALYAAGALQRMLHSHADAHYVAAFVQLVCASLESKSDATPPAEDEDGALATPVCVSVLAFLFDALPGLALAASDLEAQHVGVFLALVFAPGGPQAPAAPAATLSLLASLEGCLWPCGPRTRPGLILLTAALRALPASPGPAQALAARLAAFVRPGADVGEDVRLLAARYLTLLHQAHPAWTSLDAVAQRDSASGTESGMRVDSAAGDASTASRRHPLGEAGVQMGSPSHTVPNGSMRQSSSGAAMEVNVPSHAAPNGSKRHEAPEEGEDSAPVAKRVRTEPPHPGGGSATTTIAGERAPSRPIAQSARPVLRRERPADRQRQRPPVSARDLGAFRRTTADRPPEAPAREASARPGAPDRPQPAAPQVPPRTEDPASELVEHEARLRRSLLARRPPGDASVNDRPPSTGARRPPPPPMRPAERQGDRRPYPPSDYSRDSRPGDSRPPPDRDARDRAHREYVRSTRSRHPSRPRHYDR